TSLWVSSLFMQLVVFVVYFSNDAWLTMLAISALMVLPAYLATSAYLLQLCLSGDFSKYANKGKASALISGFIGLMFCLFMFYACEIKYLAMVPILLTLGIPLFIWSRYQEQKTLFNPTERILFVFIILLDVLTIFLYLNNYIEF
ncbi:arginine:agmatine antiporter, partial [Providencia alcalifaciens]